MRKVVLPFLLIFLFTGCTAGNVVSTHAPSMTAPVTAPNKSEEPILIRPEELRLSVGETASLACQSATGQAINNVLWKIGDENIAVITAHGTVTAVAAGETIAFAERKDNSGDRTTCPITVVEQKKALVEVNGAMIEINDKVEGIIAQDGTECIMIFDMNSVSENGIFKGQAMLRSVGMKDTGGSIPATGTVELVSMVEFTLDPTDSEVLPTVIIGDNKVALAPIVEADYRGKGTFRFIMTDVGFMALEIDLEDDDIFLEVPFEISVTGDKVGLGFSAPDGQYLSFQGKLTHKPQ